MSFYTRTVPPVSVIGVDGDGVIRTWSASAGVMLDVLAADAIGRAVTDMVDWGDDDRTRELYAGMRPGDVWVRQHQVITKSGTGFPAQTVTSAVLDLHGRAAAIVCCHAIDEIMQDPAQSYPIRAVWGQTEPLLFCNSDQLITHVATGAPSVSGLTRMQVLGHDPREFLHLDDVDTWTEMWQWALAEPGRSQSCLVRVRTIAGEHRWMEHNAINYFDNPSVASMVIHGHTASGLGHERTDSDAVAS